MEVLVKLGGLYNIALVIFHLCFWHLFSWREQLASISSINKGVMQVLNISITIIFAIFAIICIAHSSELLTTSLGNTILYSLSALYFLRAIQQVVFFKISNVVSSGLLVYFILGGIIFGVPALA